MPVGPPQALGIGHNALVGSVAENLAAVRERVEQAARLAERPPPVLIAVTKTVPVERIREAYEAGQRHFGESRLQEAAPKIEALPSDCVWHFIGRLQSNKAKKAASVFDVVHTLEGEAQAREIVKAGRPIDGLVEVNIAEEPQKSGISPEKLDDAISALLNYKLIRLKGLMTVGPFLAEPEAMRPYFRRLRELSERCGMGDWLSMGMSGDYEVAIQEGSTHIRVGSAIFGAR